MKLREADLSKKCELSRKLRINSIKSLQKTLGNLLSQEFKVMIYTFSNAESWKLLYFRYYNKKTDSL